MKKPGYLLLMLSLVACETTLSDFELEEKPPRLVINAFIGSDSLAMVHLSRSTGILEPDVKHFIDNASLTVLQNDDPVMDFDFMEHGFYKAEAVFQNAGQSFRLEATHPSLPQASASFTFPEKATILKIDTNWFRAGYVAELDMFDEEYLTFNINITDPDDEKSYFLVRVLHDYYNYTFDGQGDKVDSALFREPVYIESSSGAAQLSILDTWVYRRSSEDEQPLSGTGIVFTDELFSGDLLKIPVKTRYWDLMYDGTKDTVNVTLSIQHISPAYYLFLNSYALYDEALYNPFAQNVNVYTNVEGGYGIVATYTETSESMAVKIRIPKGD